jgi:hypothetical protein
MDNERSSADRPSDQEIKDHQQAELAEERKYRQERLGQDIRDIDETGRSNDLEAAKE